MSDVSGAVRRTESPRVDLDSFQTYVCSALTGSVLLFFFFLNGIKAAPLTAKMNITFHHINITAKAGVLL